MKKRFRVRFVTAVVVAVALAFLCSLPARPENDRAAVSSAVPAWAADLPGPGARASDQTKRSAKPRVTTSGTRKPAQSQARSQPVPLTPEQKWAALEKAIDLKLRDFTGTAGIVIKDLASGRTIERNAERLFPSASMVKVPIMVACLKAAADGRLSLQDTLKLKSADKTSGSGHLRAERSGTPLTIEKLLQVMVTESDNTAANMLIDHLGMDELNATFRELGLIHTNLARKMMDFRSRSNGIENYTTPNEMAEILEKIYRGTCAGSEVSASCLTLLKAQKVNNRISRYLPRTVEFAHKTGLEQTVCHDAGILYTENGNVLVCVLTEGDSGAIIAERWIGRIGQVIYRAYK